jgi:site-specific recombinase XerC
MGCGLRRAELVGLGTQDFQVRDERWVIADLIGKGEHIRTVPVPVWAKRAVDEWTTAAGINGWHDPQASGLQADAAGLPNGASSIRSGEAGECRRTTEGEGPSYCH